MTWQLAITIVLGSLIASLMHAKAHANTNVTHTKQATRTRHQVGASNTGETGV